MYIDLELSGRGTLIIRQRRRERNTALHYFVFQKSTFDKAGKYGFFVFVLEGGTAIIKDEQRVGQLPLHASVVFCLVKFRCDASSGKRERERDLGALHGSPITRLIYLRKLF